MYQPQVEWIVNVDGELGVKVGAELYFMYKGRAFQYSSEILYRPVEKREFGESGPVKEQEIGAHEWHTWIPTKKLRVVDLHERIRDLVHNQNKFVCAVKEYREATGSSLRDAKTAVEEITGYCLIPIRF